MSKSTAEIRQAFLDFFHSKGTSGSCQQLPGTP
ncbi:alanyl-tRNA synthetase [Escherichia coli]|nr:alanyl-tRNA synthetase [Escherichia coli]